MSKYINELKCTCGGLIGEFSCIGDESYGDELIRTAQGVCLRCGKECAYQKKYKLVGYNILTEN